MVRRLAVCLMVFIAAASAASCSSVIRGHENAAALLPGEADIPGWQLTGRPEWYSKKSIAIRLEDKSPLYMEYGVEEMAAADYRSLGEETREVSVTIYRMKSPLGAFGILSRERGFLNGKNPPVSPFEDSYILPGGLYFRKGAYYIAITSRPGGWMNIENYTGFGHIISDGIHGTENGLPDYVSLFGSRENRNDIVYYAGNYPEIPFLKGIFCRRRMLHEAEVTIYYARRSSPADAFRDFSAGLHNRDLPMMFSRTLEYQTALGGRPDGRYLIASVYREWIFGVLDAQSGSDGERLVQELFGELTAYAAVKDNPQ